MEKGHEFEKEKGVAGIWKVLEGKKGRQKLCNYLKNKRKIF